MSEEEGQNSPASPFPPHECPRASPPSSPTHGQGRACSEAATALPEFQSLPRVCRILPRTRASCNNQHKARTVIAWVPPQLPWQPVLGQHSRQKAGMCLWAAEKGWCQTTSPRDGNMRPWVTRIPSQGQCPRQHRAGLQGERSGWRSEWDVEGGRCVRVATAEDGVHVPGCVLEPQSLGHPGTRLRSDLQSITAPSAAAGGEQTLDSRHRSSKVQWTRG